MKGQSSTYVDHPVRRAPSCTYRAYCPQPYLRTSGLAGHKVSYRSGGIRIDHLESIHTSSTTRFGEQQQYRIRYLRIDRSHCSLSLRSTTSIVWPYRTRPLPKSARQVVSYDRCALQGSFL